MSYVLKRGGLRAYHLLWQLPKLPNVEVFTVEPEAQYFTYQICEALAVRPRSPPHLYMLG